MAFMIPYAAGVASVVFLSHPNVRDWTIIPAGQAVGETAGKTGMATLIATIKGAFDELGSQFDSYLNGPSLPPPDYSSCNLFKAKFGVEANQTVTCYKKVSDNYHSELKLVREFSIKDKIATQENNLFKIPKGTEDFDTIVNRTFTNTKTWVRDSASGISTFAGEKYNASKSWASESSIAAIDGVSTFAGRTFNTTKDAVNWVNESIGPSWQTTAIAAVVIGGVVLGVYLYKNAKKTDAVAAAVLTPEKQPTAVATTELAPEKQPEAENFADEDLKESKVLEESYTSGKGDDFIPTTTKAAE